MPTGVLVRWKDDKGFGFIRPDDDGPDIFCHKRAFLDGEGSVLENDECRFRIEWDDRAGKDRAADVERVGGGSRKRRRSGSRSRSRSRSRSPPRRRGGGGGDYGGGGKGGGGKGERRAGDWDCPKCGTMVFGSKDTCFKCGYDRRDEGGGGRGDSRDRGRGGGGGRGRDKSYDRGRGGGRGRDRSYSR
eukprot:TRINITY_DN7566_c1_g2_i1.p1 TRINITY_DN7566_c1_g2~~TRINITY_DN7566_c1_g2_i1.p1  ORF type:complete len:188 (-),score=42.42 TRINITY_DN7566_c1_g2_i1:451-1014(-)